MFLRAEIRRRLRRESPDDAGFTLLEVMVALLVLTLVASGTVLVLVVGSRAAAASRLNTQAKDLSQQRVESMRDLEFHVDAQNGPYIDLLDLYYTNLSTTATTRTDRGAITNSDDKETQTVRWYSSGTAPNPTNGPFFQVSVGSIPGYEQQGFSQVIDTQFLDGTGTPINAAKFTGTGAYANYNSQTEGRDAPPTLLVQVTVITTWVDKGTTKRYSLSTRIADTSSTSTGITSQATGEYLRITSNGPAGSSDALTVDVNRAQADGSQTTGSSATASAKAFEATDAATSADTLAANQTASSPGTAPTSTVTQSLVNADNPYYVAAPACSWATAGASQVTNVSAITGGGLPQVPSSVGSSETSPAATTSASLMANSGTSCHEAVWFDNQPTLSAPYDSTMRLDASDPLVAIPDTTSGNSAVTTGSAWVNASNAVTTPHWVSSGASISTASGSSATVQIFPGASFLPSNRSTSQEGLVNVRISSASLVCQSDVPANAGTRTYGATLTYSGTIGYWSYVNGSYQYTTLTLSNTNATDPLAAVPLTTTMVYPGTSGNPLYLSDFISSWSTPHGQIAERTNNGLFAVPGVVDITTMPMRDSSGTTTIDPTSSVGVEVGDLSCAAADNR